MKCYNHHSTEAVGVCRSCGKAICKACASEATTGRLFCSLQCAKQPLEKRHFTTGSFLLGLGGLLVVFAVRLSMQQSLVLGVIMVLYALGCLLVGAAMLQQDTAERNDPFTPFYKIFQEIRWRAGIALRQAHKFRKDLDEALKLFAKVSGETITVSQMESADASTTKQVLEKIYSRSGNIPHWQASTAQEAAIALEERVRLSRALGWTYFSQHDSRDNSYPARHEMLMELITAAYKLDHCSLLWAINRGLKEQISAQEKAGRLPTGSNAEKIK